jgi:hypothetical protein
MHWEAKPEQQGYNEMEMSKAKIGARTYNQNHVPRKYSPGRRRVSIYISWSYPGESNRPLEELDNRFSTMTEVRRVFWPKYEWASDPLKFSQGIAGTLELFFRSWLLFQEVLQETTGHPVPVFQRVDQAGYHLPLDERVLGDVDTLLVFSLDHQITRQEATPAEIEAVRQFLTREGTCVVLGPHHDVGVSDDPKVRDREYYHHGDALVPRQQRFGTFGLSMLKGLGIPVENRYGLNPATVPGTNQIAPLSIARDLDTKGWLEGVTAFNWHPHLPHYALTTDNAKSVYVLAKQPINPSAPTHPFTEAGNREFNALVWVAPNGKQAGDILVADSTIFTTLFGGVGTLERFWKNLAKG